MTPKRWRSTICESSGKQPEPTGQRHGQRQTDSTAAETLDGSRSRSGVLRAEYWTGCLDRCSSQPLVSHRYRYSRNTDLPNALCAIAFRCRSLNLGFRLCCVVHPAAVPMTNALATQYRCARDRYGHVPPHDSLLRQMLLNQAIQRRPQFVRVDVAAVAEQDGGAIGGEVAVVGRFKASPGTVVAVAVKVAGLVVV